MSYSQRVEFYVLRSWLGLRAMGMMHIACMLSGWTEMGGLGCEELVPGHVSWSMCMREGWSQYG